MPQKISPKTIALIFSVLIICFAVSFYVFGGDDWGEPAELPPGGNVPAPVNVSINPQTKTGGLRVGGNGPDDTLVSKGMFDAWNLARFGDKVGIGTGEEIPRAKLDVNGAIGPDGAVYDNFWTGLNYVWQPPGFLPGDYAKAGVYSDMSQFDDHYGLAGYFKGRYHGITAIITEQSPSVNYEYRAVTGGNVFIDENGKDGQEHAYWGALGVVFHPEGLSPGDYAKAGVYSNMEQLDDQLGIAGYFKGRYQGITSTITEQSPPVNHEYRAVTGGNLFIGEEGQEHAYWGALGSVINLPGSGIVRVGVYSNMEKLNDPDALAGYFVGNVRATGTICDNNGCIGTGGGTGYWTKSSSDLFPTDTGVNVGIGTTGPRQKLSVNGVIGVWNANEVNFYTDDGSSLKGYVGAGRNNDLSLVSKINWNWLRIGSNNAPITFWANNGADSDENPQVIIKPDGSVGIGTPYPTEKLDVAGYVKGRTGLCIGDVCRTSWPDGGGIACSDCDSRFVNTTGDVMTGPLTIDTSGNDKIYLKGTQSYPHTIWLGNSKGVRFWDGVGNRELMRISNSGDVGIERIPDYKLDVANGDIAIRNGNLRLYGALYDTFGGGDQYWLDLDNGGNIGGTLVVENKIGIGTDDPKASSKLAISANTGVYSEVPDVYNQTLVIASNDAGIGLWSSKESDESSNIRLGEIDLDKGEMTDVWTIGRFANTNPTSSETVAPGSFRITYGTDLGYCHTPYFMIKKDGTVGIGTATPATGYKLDVEGKIQATGFDTGDITFRDQETDKILWRMFEDEDGLYLENMKTGKIFRFVLEEVIE